MNNYSAPSKWPVVILELTFTCNALNFWFTHLPPLESESLIERRNWPLGK